MKHFSFAVLSIMLILSICLFFSCKRKSNDITFIKTFGGESYDYGNSVQPTLDGGYIIVGYTSSFGAGGIDVYLIKTDADGNQLWYKTFGGTGHEYGESVLQTSDGGYIIVGYTSSFGAGQEDVYLIKINENGDQLWYKTFGGTDYDKGTSVLEQSDGSYIISGCTRSFGAGDYNVYLIKTDNIGNQQWFKTFGGTDMEWGNSVQPTSDGGYIITGITASFGTTQEQEDVILIKTDADGNQQWYKTFGGEDFDHGSSVLHTADGGYIISGYTHSFGAGKSDVYLIKTDGDGNQQWYKTIGGKDTDLGYSIQPTVDGGYIIAGYTHSFGAGEADVYLIKIDSDGNQQWYKTFGGINYDYGFAVQTISDSGYIVTGSTESFGYGYADVYLIKTDSNGNVD